MAKKKSKKKSNKKAIKTSKRDSKKIILIWVLVFIVIGVLAATIYNINNIKKKTSNNGVEIMELREFIDVNVADVIKKINDKESFVLYVGYTGCQACESYNPILKRVQSQNNSDTYYLDYKSIDKSSKDWLYLTNKINVVQSFKVSEEEEIITVDDKIGNIMKDYGYTPVTIVFTKGECVNAYIGLMSSIELERFFGI